MPILDSAARLRDLRCTLGVDRAAIAPTSYKVHLYVGDPALGGVEMATTTQLENLTVVSNGYAPVTISAASFVADDLGMTQRVQFGNALAEWPDSATHWVLRDATVGAATIGEGWDYAPLSEPLDVTAAGPGPAVNITVFYDDAVNSPA